MPGTRCSRWPRPRASSDRASTNRRSPWCRSTRHRETSRAQCSPSRSSCRRPRTSSARRARACERGRISHLPCVRAESTSVLNLLAGSPPSAATTGKRNGSVLSLGATMPLVEPGRRCDRGRSAFARQVDSPRRRTDRPSCRRRKRELGLDVVGGLIDLGPDGRERFYARVAHEIGVAVVHRVVAELAAVGERLLPRGVVARVPSVDRRDVVGHRNAGRLMSAK